MQTVSKLMTPKLDSYEQSVKLHGQSESLREVDFGLLQMLMRYPEERLSREELKRCFDRPALEVTDRQLDTAMRRLIKHMLALWPAFPLIKFEPEDAYIYSEKAPKKKKPVEE